MIPGFSNRQLPFGVDVHCLRSTLRYILGAVSRLDRLYPKKQKSGIIGP
jgi:hypothetical protein